MKEIKKQKQKTQIRVSGQEYAFAYIGLRMQPNCMHTHTRPENPSPKTKNTENRAEPKTIKLLTCI